MSGTDQRSHSVSWITERLNIWAQVLLCIHMYKETLLYSLVLRKKGTEKEKENEEGQSEIEREREGSLMNSRLI
jgi:hypothetical protein